MMDAVAHVCDVVRRRDVDVSKTLMARALALDIIFLKYANGIVAVAGPTHPFHLWRWVEIARLLQQHTEEVREKLGEDILLTHASNPPVYSPHITLSSYLDADVKENKVFIGIGSIGSLPLYGDPDSRTTVKFRAVEVGDIAQRFVAMSPYSRFGFEVVAIDPPGLSDVIEALINVNKGLARTELIPVHVRVFRTREIPTATEEEDVEMEELVTVLREIRGSLEIEAKRLSFDEIQQRLKDRPAHYTLVFEPGESQKFDISIDFSPTLSPLVIPRHYHYSQISDKFDVIIHGDATPFGAYYELFKNISNIPDKGAFGRRSGAGRDFEKVSKIGKHTMWFSVIDQGIEPTFKVPDAIRLDKRTMGGRDIHTFTSQPETIMRYVKKVIETGELIPYPETQKRTFRLMQRLGGDTVPIVVSTASKTGQIVLQQAKGLLGVLAVTAWYEKEDPDALLISLDTEASRRWILGIDNEDGRRGDLLCLRQTHDGIRLEVIESKARDDETGLFTVDGGKVGGTFKGPAIDQIDNTVEILKLILPKDGASGIDKARREILRDQLYMSVAHRALTPDRRARAVKMLDEFFSIGSYQIIGRLFIVHVETDKVPEYPVDAKKRGVSTKGNSIEVYEILESEVNGTPKPETTAEQKTSKPDEDPLKKREPKKEAVIHLPEEEGKKRAKITKDREHPKEDKAGLVQEPVVEKPKGLVVVIGQDPAKKDVTWDPSKNPNFGVMITGDAGYGKTQTIRAIMLELRKHGYPLLVFDFKNDYSDEEFKKRLNLTVYDVVEKGLPFNPLGLIPNEQGYVQPIRQCHEFAAIVSRVVDLGEQQEHRLVEAQKKAYESHGLDPKKKYPVEEIKSEPVFEEVLQNLKDEDDAVSRKLSYRIQKFSDLGLFPSHPTESTFEDLIKDGIVLRLYDAGNDKLMQILAEIMIVKLHAIIKRGDQPLALRRMLVFDEAWRIAKSERLVDLAREGRAYGVGILIGTQYPKDMPENLVSALRTQVYLYNKEIANQQVILRALCNTTHGAEAERFLKTIRNFGKFQGYLISDQYKSGTRVDVLPYHERLDESEEH